MIDIAIDNSQTPIAHIADNWPDPKDRARRMRDAHYEAFRAAQEECETAGVEVHGNSRLARLFQTGYQLGNMFERHAFRLERTLRSLLTADVLTDDQRAAALGVLFGRKSFTRDPKHLTVAETDLIANYRAASTDGKHMLRTVATLAARTAEDGVR